jgi:hypothetical protein
MTHLKNSYRRFYFPLTPCASHTTFIWKDFHTPHSTFTDCHPIAAILHPPLRAPLPDLQRRDVPMLGVPNLRAPVPDTLTLPRAPELAANAAPAPDVPSCLHARPSCPSCQRAALVGRQITRKVIFCFFVVNWTSNYKLICHWMKIRI